MASIPPLARFLLGAAALLAVAALVVWALSAARFPVGRLPGDVRIERPGFRFHFPIATSLLVSLLLTLAFWVFAWLRRR